MTLINQNDFGPSLSLSKHLYLRIWNKISKRFRVIGQRKKDPRLAKNLARLIVLSDRQSYVSIRMQSDVVTGGQTAHWESRRNWGRYPNFLTTIRFRKRVYNAINASHSTNPTSNASPSLRYLLFYFSVSY